MTQNKNVIPWDIKRKEALLNELKSYLSSPDPTKYVLVHNLITTRIEADVKENGLNKEQAIDKAINMVCGFIIDPDSLPDFRQN